MRVELQETGAVGLTARLHTERTASRDAEAAGVGPLEPHAVDAALADETLTIVTERGSRRDLSKRNQSGETVKRLIDDPHRAASPVVEEAGETEEDGDDAILRSLSEQLELLTQQQRQIRMLLDQAQERRR